MKKVTVKFYPDNKQVEIEKGKTILAAAISAGVQINSSCGGEGVCGRCKVIVKSGKIQDQPTGRITQEEKKRGYVLACLSIIESDLEVDVPMESRLDLDKVSESEAYQQRLKGLFGDSIEIDGGVSILPKDFFVHSPLTTKVYLEIPQPNLEDKISDLERVYREIKKKQDISIIQTGIANIRGLGQLLRSSNWKITVILGKRNGTVEIVSIEPGDTSSRNFGIAFDIGTTTISGQLINLNTKQILGTMAKFNKQASFGSDVITRIIFSQKEDGLERLHHAVIDGMNEIIQELTSEYNVDLNNVTSCLCAGNTTMIHLLLKIDPAFIRREPYVPTANFIPVIRTAQAGIKISPRGLLLCAPGVSSYVGADITAGILACGIANSSKTSLLIDIGTNGEIALGNKDWLISCAASAGPAFEGSGVKSGMRAVKGAIQQVKINPKNFKIKFTTIEKAPPKGICGSGYIDILKECLAAGIIKKDGTINTDLKIKDIRKSEFGQEFLIASKEEAGLENDIVITEADIENLKRAKAAIFSAASILVNQMGLTFQDLDKIFVAGGFGTSLDIENAISVGLLPDLPRKKFVFVGNSSLIGARQILLSSDAAVRVEEIARKTTYFELSVEAKYMDEYMSALFFPHTDQEKFPTVNF